MIELAFHLIESYLVPELGSDARTQDRIAFAIQELLQFLMNDINATAASLEVGNTGTARVCGTLLPFKVWQSAFELEVGKMGRKYVGTTALPTAGNDLTKRVFSSCFDFH